MISSHFKINSQKLREILNASTIDRIYCSKPCLVYEKKKIKLNRANSNFVDTLTSRGFIVCVASILSVLPDTSRYCICRYERKWYLNRVRIVDWTTYGYKSIKLNVFEKRWGLSKVHYLSFSKFQLNRTSTESNHFSVTCTIKPTLSFQLTFALLECILHMYYSCI